jgi:low affinity Fe/Cu permease
VGTPIAFVLALLLILVWAATGPLFAFSDTWQLVINTGTTIITFLVVFAIQNTQNRDTKAIELKLDELIKAQKQARNLLLDVEEMTDEELATLEREYHEASKQVAQQRQGRERDDDDVDDEDVQPRSAPSALSPRPSR